MKFRTARRVTLVLGAVSSVGILLAMLALQDISHGEPGLGAEWAALRISFLLIIAFHAAALFTLWKVQDWE